MVNSHHIHRLAAFAREPGGGNPAGVWIGNAMPSVDSMQSLAREIGYSETAFVTPATGREKTIRYFSPRAEVPFCGHATIATGVLLGELQGPGNYLLQTRAGKVALDVNRRGDHFVASLTSVPPRQKPVPSNLLREVLTLLNWQDAQLDPTLPAMLIYAGAWHLLVAVNSLARLQTMQYPFEAMKTLMLDNDLTTLQLVWRQRDDLFHSRNPFPVGDVVEDAATGAAAAALGGYLRDQKLVATPTRITVLQGEAMGRPSQLQVDIAATGGIEVSGSATALTGEEA